MRQRNDSISIISIVSIQIFQKKLSWCQRLKNFATNNLLDVISRDLKIQSSSSNRMKIKTWAEVACALLWLSILLIVSKIIASFLKAECASSIIDEWLWLESRTIKIQLTSTLFRAKQKKKTIHETCKWVFSLLFMKFMTRFFFTIAAKINLHDLICFETFLESLFNNCIVFRFDMLIDCQNKCFERKIHRIDERRSQIHDHDKEIKCENKKMKDENLNYARWSTFFLISAINYIYSDKMITISRLSYHFQ
jgi:hypothetical protein